jgi:cellulose biosynthesis protein BcsQ
MVPPVKSIAFFNNKGGVGKTTLACNFAAYLAKKKSQSVIVIDCDPQANATQLLLDDSVWEGIYEDKKAAEEKTVLRALKNIRAGDSTIDSAVTLQDAPRFQVKVLAGHPSLSVIEDRLSSSWGEFLAGTLGGARRSLWARQLLSTLSADVVIFDLGPSLGALNRSVLLGSDYFVTPVAADLFSLYALENIGDWLEGWIKDYSGARERMSKQYTQELDQYDIPDELPVAAGWAGYSVQQYVAKTTAGKVRRVAAYDRYRRQIPERAANLDAVAVPKLDYKELGIVPNMFSLVPLAQAAHAPISDLQPSDGVRGAQVTQQARYLLQLNDMFTRLSANLDL